MLGITLLRHGCPTQARVAACGRAARTVARWVLEAGRHCQRIHEPLVEPGQGDRQHGPALTAGIGLVGTADHFCWPHDSRRLLAPPDAPRPWHQRTPARAAGRTDHGWTLLELLPFQIPLPPGCRHNDAAVRQNTRLSALPHDHGSVGCYQTARIVHQLALLADWRCARIIDMWMAPHYSPRATYVSHSLRASCRICRARLPRDFTSLDVYVAHSQRGGECPPTDLQRTYAWRMRDDRAERRGRIAEVAEVRRAGATAPGAERTPAPAQTPRPT